MFLRNIGHYGRDPPPMRWLFDMLDTDWRDTSSVNHHMFRSPQIITWRVRRHNGIDSLSPNEEESFPQSCSLRHEWPKCEAKGRERGMVFAVWEGASGWGLGVASPSPQCRETGKRCKLPISQMHFGAFRAQKMRQEAEDIVRSGWKFSP